MPDTINPGMEKFSYSENEVGDKGMDSDYGSTEVYFYDPAFAANMNFTKTAGWGSAGRLTAINDTPNFQNLDVKHGSPKMLKTSLITEIDHELQFTFDHPTLLGLKLSRASSFAQKLFYATGTGNGQTTVKTGSDSSNTRYSTQVTAVTGIQAGDFIEVDPRDATNGGFIQVIKVLQVIGDIVYHTKVDASLKAGNTFKKLAGNRSGSSDANTGIQTLIGAVKHPEIACKIVHNVTNNRSKEIKGYYRCVNTTGTPKNFGDGSALATITITLKPIKVTQTVEDDNGRSYEAGIYGREIIIPDESPFTPA